MSLFHQGTLLVGPHGSGGAAGLVDLISHATSLIGTGLGSGEAGSPLDDGTTILMVNAATYEIVSPDMVITHTPVPFTVTTLIDAFSPTCVVPGASATSWYVSYVQNHASPANAQIRKVMIDGSLGGTTFTLAIAAIAGLAVNAAETIAYYGDDATGGAIKRWDLVNNIALSDLVAGATTNQIGSDFLILDSGKLFVLYAATSVAPIPWTIRRYSSAGALELTITLSADAGRGSAPRLQRDLGDTSSVCVQTFPTNAGDITTFEFYDVSSGLLKTSFTVPNGGGGEIPFCCPFFPWSFSGGGAIQVFVGTQQTRELVRVRQVGLPALPGNVTQFIGRAEVQMQPGLGVPADPTQAPTIQMAWSGDNAVTFNTAQPLSLGRTGAYYTRAYKHVVGSLRQPAVKLICSDDVTFVPTDLFVTREEGSG